MSATFESRRLSAVQCVQIVLVLAPVSLLGTFLLPFMAAGALGAGLAALDHWQSGDSFLGNLEQAAMFVGSAVGCLSGCLALWLAVLCGSVWLSRTRGLWWITVLGLVAGIWSATYWLTSGYYPRHSFLFAYPLVAGLVLGVVYSLRLAFAKVRNVIRGAG